MKLFAILAAFLVPTLLPAQQSPGDSPKVPSAAVAVPLAGELIPKVGILSAGDDAEFTLRITVREEMSLPQELLSGNALKVYGDSAGGADADLPEGGVTVAADTVVERSLKLPAAAFGQMRDDTALVRAVVRWPGLPGAMAELELAPDVSDVAIGDMDLSKTRVVLATNFGQMTLGFRPDKAPRHVENYIKLAKSGFYDGTKFHRIIKGFMVQGGCPNTKEGAQGQPGQGDPGYKIAAEFNDMPHTRGVLSMARAQDPNSAGCQFFICHGDARFLDGKYSGFGYLEKGSDVLDRIANVPVGGPNGTPVLEDVHLYKAVVIPVLK